MSILNKVFRNEKVLINIFSAILFVFGILFGIIYYFYVNISFFSKIMRQPIIIIYILQLLVSTYFYL